MLTLKQVWDEETIQRLTEKRKTDFSSTVSEIRLMDEHRKKTQQALDSCLQKANEISKQVGDLFKKGEAAAANDLKSESSALKEKSKGLQEQLRSAEEDMKSLLYKLPNVPHAKVVAGVDETDNEVVFESGGIPAKEDGLLPHWELAKKHEIIDFELGVKIAGAGFPLYIDKGARLQRGLINMFLDHNTEAGYTEYLPPLFVNEASGIATGNLPDKEGQMYHMQVDDLYAIPTAEVPVTNIFRDDIVNPDKLPLKCTAYTPCFRREAGSYGAHVRGLNRLHQFDKVEIVQVTHPDKSYDTLEEMLQHVKALMAKLELPYRILRLCGGDTTFASAMTYDFEVWSKAQDRWLEVSSVSNFETFQANRLKLRYKDETGKTQLCHTLNGSSLALPRIVAALLEHNQNSDGTVSMPAAVIPYVGFDKIGQNFCREASRLRFYLRVTLVDFARGIFAYIYKIKELGYEKSNCTPIHAYGTALLLPTAFY